MDGADPFDILGISRDARPEEIRAAYRRLALALHPDRRPEVAEAEAEFRRMRAAYLRLMAELPPLDPDSLELFEPAAVRGGAYVCRAMIGAEERRLRIEVPRDTRDGHKLRVLGHALIVRTVPLPEGQRFGRRGFEVDLPLRFSELALGATVRAPVGLERVPVEVPPRSAPGSTLVVPGRGLGAVDLVLALNLVMPDAGRAAVREALERLGAAEPSPRAWDRG